MNDLSNNNMEKRSVLYMGACTLDEEPAAGLEQADWRVFSTPDPQHANELLSQNNISVGLVHFSKAMLENKQHSIENLLADAKDVRWVGLVEPAVLADTQTRRLIADYLYDYHTLPVETDHLSGTLGHAYGMACLAPTVMPEEENRVNGYQMVAASPVMRSVIRTIHKIAKAEAPAILTGESGTGKELAALAIHKHSSRAQGPFVAVNCGALAEGLIQSELFGHEKGAFTGAHRDRVGRIEAAHGGTIFLDEIGDLSLELQVNLLRFLQEGTIERVGQVKSIAVDVRVIAATYIDLQKAVEEGRFREDLYYRLNVLRLELPPLRERNGDVVQLANHYFNIFSKERNKRIHGFNSSALQALDMYSWPGNVRELINRVRRGVVMCERSLITPADLGLEQLQKNTCCIRTLAQVRAESEKLAVDEALQHCRYNVSKTARVLGISRLTLYRLIEKYNLSRNEQADSIGRDM